MKVSAAKVMGSCFGVEDAVEMAMKDEDAGNLTILGQLVHNPQTVEALQKKGITLLEGVDAIDHVTTGKVMITAHGAADRIKTEAESKGHQVIDATCPLVQRVHKTIKKMVAEGFFPVVVGEVKHVEVKGIVGDLDEYCVIQNADELEQIHVSKRARLGIVSQTTQNVDFVEKVVEKIKSRDDVKEVKFVNTVCKPTRDRQKAVEELCDLVDVMVVVGGKNSSNTKKLRLLCEKRGIDSYHVERASELNPDWFIGKQHAGITAGTSTPMSVIEEVQDYLLAIGRKLD